MGFAHNEMNYENIRRIIREEIVGIDLRTLSDLYRLLSDYTFEIVPVFRSSIVEPSTTAVYIDEECAAFWRFISNGDKPYLVYVDIDDVRKLEKDLALMEHLRSL